MTSPAAWRAGSCAPQPARQAGAAHRRPAGLPRDRRTRGSQRAPLLTCCQS